MWLQHTAAWSLLYMTYVVGFVTEAYVIDLHSPAYEDHLMTSTLYCWSLTIYMLQHPDVPTVCEMYKVGFVTKLSIIGLHNLARGSNFIYYNIYHNKKALFNNIFKYELICNVVCNGALLMYLDISSFLHTDSYIIIHITPLIIYVVIRE